MNYSKTKYRILILERKKERKKETFTGNKNAQKQVDEQKQDSTDRRYVPNGPHSAWLLKLLSLYVILLLVVTT